MNESLKKKSNAQKFRYLVVLDFEATCDKNRRINPQEIIEWPAFIIDTKTNEVLDDKDKKFHFYIRPKHNPKLTKFCQEFTGITQQFIDKNGSENTIESVTKEWNKWCFKNDLLPISASKPVSAIITCGDWDLKTMWKYQQSLMQRKKINNDDESLLDFNASLFHSWINLKQIFKQNTYNFYYNKHQGISMMSMLKHFNIKHTGKHHSGIADVKNLCKIVHKLLEIGAKFDYTMKNFGRRNIETDLKIKRILTIKNIDIKKDDKAIIDLTSDDNTNSKDDVKNNKKTERRKDTRAKSRSVSRSRSRSRSR